jgi:F0F1-type ATP synthase assembly protein I
MGTDVYFVVKGTIATLAVVLLVWHMNDQWSKVASKGRRLRYLTLFCFAVLVIARSGNQVHGNADIDSFAIGGMFNVCLLVYAMVVSIREDREKT